MSNSIVLPNVIAAVVYAGAVIGLRIRRGSQSIGWGLAAIGTSAVCALFVVVLFETGSKEGGEPSLTGVAEYVMIWFAAGAAIGGLVVGYVFFKLFKLPRAWVWSLMQAAVYVIGTIVLATHHS